MLWYLVLLVLGLWWLKGCGRKVVPKQKSVVVVTGAGRGLGRAIALRYAKERCFVVGIDVDTSSFEGLTHEIEALGARALCLKCDVASPAEVTQCIAHILNAVHRVDILICNAGIAHEKYFEDLSASQFRHTIDVNFFGVVHLIQSFLSLAKLPKQIAVVSSVLAFDTTVKVSEYSASKAALHSFLTVLRMENRQKRRDVHITEVCPWHIATDMFQTWRLRWGLFPPLSVEYVSDKLFDAVCKRRPIVIIPWYQWYVFTLFQQLPTGLHDWLALHFLA